MVIDGNIHTGWDRLDWGEMRSRKDGIGREKRWDWGEKGLDWSRGEIGLEESRGKEYLSRVSNEG